MSKKLTLEEIFNGYNGENPQSKEIDFGEDVGRERFYLEDDENQVDK